MIILRNKFIGCNTSFDVHCTSEPIVQSVEMFLDAVFSSLSAPLVDVKSLTGQPCIINNLETTMGHEYIGTDSLISNIEEIEAASSRPPDYREKPLVAVVLGSGGGKLDFLRNAAAV